MERESVRETYVEAYLVRHVRELGGKAYKWSSPGQCNVPDRICIFPGPDIWFVEVKKPGEAPRPGQVREMARLSALKCDVTWVSSKAEIDQWLANAICVGGCPPERQRRGTYEGS